MPPALLVMVPPVQLPFPSAIRWKSVERGTGVVFPFAVTIAVPLPTQAIDPVMLALLKPAA